MDQKKQSKTLKIFSYIFGIVAILFTIYSMFNLYRYKILNFNNINTYLYIAGIVCIFLIIICMFKFKKTNIVLSIFVILLNIGASFTLQSVVGMFDKFNNNAKYEETNVGIYVLKDSKKTDLNSIITELKENKDIIIMGAKNDEETSEKTKKKLIEDIIAKNNNELKKDQIETKIKIEYKNTYVDIYNDILSKEREMMILNSAYNGILELHDEKYNDKIKSIYETNLKEEIRKQEDNLKTEEKQAENNNSEEKHIGKKKGVYNIYISGIDVAGNINTVSRSDVNIIMTVNTNTKKILLTTTPRDSYVKIPRKRAKSI